MTADALPFICPACHVGVAQTDAGYECAACRRVYPILFGIPDFRIRPDRYLSLYEERAKAGRLFDFARNATFAELVDFYYSITDDVPPNLARNFARYVHEAPHRAQRIIDTLEPQDSDGILLDIGCGSGGGLIAVPGRFAMRVGVDIGLRWLVIAQKRLAEAGLPASLVCADAAALPFADAEFTHAIADDLIEHVYEPDAAVAEIARKLRPSGMVWVSATNRFWIGPHPVVGIWAAGFMPAALRSWVMRTVRGVDSLRNTEMVSAASTLRAARRNGLAMVTARARRFDPQAVALLPPFLRAIAAIYDRLASLSATRGILLWSGPAFEIVFRRSSDRVGG